MMPLCTSSSRVVGAPVLRKVTNLLELSIDVPRVEMLAGFVLYETPK